MDAGEPYVSDEAPAESPAVARTSVADDFTQTYRAAGVLPFASYNDKVFVLLGSEPKRTGPGGMATRCLWSDFGGQREAVDTDVAATASREFSEETLGLFGNCSVDASSVALSAKKMAEQLRAELQSLQIVYQLRDGRYYVMYCAQTAYLDSIFFDLATQQNLRKQTVIGAEKSSFAWVLLADLLRELDGKSQSYHLFLEKVGGRRRWHQGKRHMQLHPSFAASLKLAQAAGLQEFANRLAVRPQIPRSPMPASRRAASKDVDPQSVFYFLANTRVAAELKGIKNCNAPWPREVEELEAKEDCTELAIAAVY